MKIVRLLILIICIATVGCLGRNDRQPLRQITAFLISVPCATVGAGNECYEVVYQIIDKEPTTEGE